MKKLLVLVSLTALFSVTACKKAEVFPVSANDTIRVDTLKMDTLKVDTLKENTSL